MNDKTSTADATAAANAAAAGGVEGAKTPAAEGDQAAAPKGAAPPASDAAASANAPKPPKDAAKTAEPVGETPAWQLPHYAGPLTIPQSQWRLANIKPQQARTK